jgi:hypothetical protein
LRRTCTCNSEFCRVVCHVGSRGPGNERARPQFAGCACIIAAAAAAALVQQQQLEAVIGQRLLESAAAAEGRQKTIGPVFGNKASCLISAQYEPPLPAFHSLLDSCKFLILNTLDSPSVPDVQCLSHVYKVIHGMSSNCLRTALFSLAISEVLRIIINSEAIDFYRIEQ